MRDKVLKGGLHEAQVLADLMQRGFEVFHGFTGKESCDLVAKKHNSTLCIEVKGENCHGTKNQPPKGPVASLKQSEDCRNFDVLAFVFDNGQIQYNRSCLHQLNKASADLPLSTEVSKKTNKKWLLRAKYLEENRDAFKA
jgi:hypothetical protein